MDRTDIPGIPAIGLGMMLRRALETSGVTDHNSDRLFMDSLITSVANQHRVKNIIDYGLPNEGVQFEVNFEDELGSLVSPVYHMKNDKDLLQEYYHLLSCIMVTHEVGRHLRGLPGGKTPRTTLAVLTPVVHNKPVTETREAVAA